MTNIIDLAKFRGGNDKRSVVDTLREVAREIEEGEIKPDMVYVAMREQVPNSEDIDYIWSMSSLTNFERVGLLSRHLLLAGNK